MTDTTTERNREAVALRMLHSYLAADHEAFDRALDGVHPECSECWLMIAVYLASRLGRHLQRCLGEDQAASVVAAELANYGDAEPPHHNSNHTEGDTN